jgi:ZIP family zinc transporter
VSTAEILGLGAVAGFTIFLGLPVARMRRVAPATKIFLSAVATGILLFLLWDVLSGAVEPVESALEDGHGGTFAWYSTLLTVGFGVGLLALVYYDDWMKRRRRKAFLGPGAASTAEFEVEHHFYGGMSPARWLAVFIATGIGLHNFAEGLAIGQSAAAGDISLAIVLIIGFGLHNATEGFGIVAPLSGEKELPSWSFLLALGLIGGAPTFLGTVVGQAWTSTPVSILFLSLAAGSILYVVIELLNVCRLFGRKTLITWGILLGLILGFGTDFILVAAGA